MIGRAVVAWELPLLRRAEKDGNRVPSKVLELFTQYCKDFKDDKDAKANEVTVPKELTKAEKTKLTKAKNKAKKEADAEVAKLKAEREAEESKEKTEE